MKVLVEIGIVNPELIRHFDCEALKDVLKTIFENSCAKSTIESKHGAVLTFKKVHGESQEGEEEVDPTKQGLKQEEQKWHSLESIHGSSL